MAEVHSGLVAWVGAYFVQNNLGDPTLSAIAGDAGFRQYYRVHTNAGPGKAESPLCALAVYGPPDIEKHEAFVSMAERLRHGGVKAPKVYAADFDNGFLLVEDLGKDALLDQLSANSVDALYKSCLKELVNIQLCDTTGPLPAYNAFELRREMSLFTDWFVPQLLGYTLDDAEKSLVEQMFSVLEDSAAEQSDVLVHRDFHSRNIICQADGGIGVIDFQDGLKGPITYDLDSLLRDCYVVWPQAQVAEWLEFYRVYAHEMGVINNVSSSELTRWFDLMGLQRHIKVLGIFARLFIRDGKAGYLKDLPLVVAYTRYVAKQYSELESFAVWFDAALMPLIEKCDWYHSVDVHL